MTSINKLRNRVKLYEIGYVSDGIGGSVEQSTLITSLWARIEQGTGNTILEGQTLNATKPVTITLRAGSYNITTDNIIRFNGRDYTISSVSYDERNRFTICQASTGNILDEYYVTNEDEDVTYNNNKITFIQ